MADSNNNSSSGIGFCGLLTIVFIVLKLTDHIDWSWWWVLSPVWVTAAVFVALILIMVLAGLLSIYMRKGRRRNK